VTYTATVTSTTTDANPNPTTGEGTVTFKDGATIVCSAVALSTAGTATCPTAALSAGSHTITAQYTGITTGRGFEGSTSSGLPQTVTALQVTGSFTAKSKVYDGTTSATIDTRSLSGQLAGAKVSLDGGSATFADKNVGTGKTVTATGFSLTGDDAANYSLASSTLTAKADITALGITGSFTAANKVYDATTSATITGGSLTGALSGDKVSLSGGTATFDTAAVANGKTVTGTGFSLTGDDAANYSLTSVGTTTADITALQVTGAFTAKNKVYDGTTSATIDTRSLTGQLAGAKVSLDGGSATFADKSVGTGKTVTATGFTLVGDDAANYSLASSTLTAKADITALGITGSFTAANKVYDGTTAATITGGSLTGALSGDKVSLSGGTATFDTAAVKEPVMP
ncbi:MAG: YDG domain-containing protein, partial [Actinobacteria bacterium]|nr:YDG domain-containing protein [Actinomycetota bacterium]